MELNLVMVRVIGFVLAAIMPLQCVANDLLLSWGTGSQPNSSQRNNQVSLDYDFLQFQRSSRTTLSLGVGFSHLTTDARINKSINAISVYPQLTLYPVSEPLRDFYFFVRALGPTILSSNSLGEREQDNHFAFQAQVGIGRLNKLSNGSTLLLQLSWKHISNANLFNDNDGIDLPFVLSLGYRF